MKLHLGCGKRYLSGYVHIDLAGYKHIDHQHDIRTLPMFKDSTVDLIYASHVFEYFDESIAVSVLKEWRRVLKKGGILRLAVPDFTALVMVYMVHGKLDLICGPLYGEWKIPGLDKTICQHTVYDFPSLVSVLFKAGFKIIRLWDWKKIFVGKYKGFDDYSQAYVPHGDKEKGILISLNMEAEK